MQLAARVEKLTPPTTEEVCAAAGLAVIGLLEDERSQPDGPWFAPLEAWQGGGKIRKLVRRGRASAWERAQEPAGYTAVVGNAEVRAYLPSPMDQVPEPVAKLQIKSTELSQAERRSALLPATSGLVVLVTPEVEMSWGKMAAQCAHAVQLLWRQSDADVLATWTAARRPVSIALADAGLWQAAMLEVDGAVQVRDGGFTEIPAGTLTAIARWSS